MKPKRAHIMRGEKKKETEKDGSSRSNSSLIKLGLGLWWIWIDGSLSGLGWVGFDLGLPRPGHYHP